METNENYQEEISSEDTKKTYEACELYEKTMHFMVDSLKISTQAKALFNLLHRHAGVKPYAMLSLNTLKKKLGWSIPKVRTYMKELVAASIVKIVHQVRKDGGYGCNRYYLSLDIKDWFRPEDYENHPMYKHTEKKDTDNNKVPNTGKEKSKSCAENNSKPTSVPAAAPTTAADTLQYSMEFITEHYEFHNLFEKADDWCLKKDEIESIKDIIYDVLNASDKKQFVIKGSSKPASVVKSRFLKLTQYNILSTLKRFESVTNVVKDYTSYLITMLYESFSQDTFHGHASLRQLDN